MVGEAREEEIDQAGSFVPVEDRFTLNVHLRSQQGSPILPDACTA